MSVRNTILFLLTIFARIAAVLLGILLFGPAVMASDSGTREARLSSWTLIVVCALLILSGAFGNVNIVLLALATLAVGLIGTGCHFYTLTSVYLCVIVPATTVLLILIQFHAVSWEQVTAFLSTIIGKVNMQDKDSQVEHSNLLRNGTE